MATIKPFPYILLIGLVPTITLFGITLLLIDIELTDVETVVIAFSVMGLLLAVVLGVYHIFRISVRHMERIQMIEADREFPEDNPSHEGLLVGGSLSLSVGLAILISVFAFPEKMVIVALGMSLLFSGLALFALFAFFKIHKK